ncbi:MAG: hypothetical protein C5B53_12150 [Candidatus Melainabacteria bacterium]|nr:MAG: hypothetical protein C5B53_12150 [Candidatus Melainabacteria bacterium]
MINPKRTVSTKGSILPFAAFALVLIAAFVSFSFDIMRNVYAVRKLDYAAESAALYAYSNATAADGSYSRAAAQTNMTNALLSNGVAPINTAPAGPNNWSDPFESPVTFAAQDIVFNSNPSDQSELLLRVTARRDGADALNMFFLPATYLGKLMQGQNAPQDAYVARPTRTEEIIGQPASRIGPGAPGNAGQNGSSPFIGAAVFPLAISNTQFSLAAIPSETRSNYIIDLPTAASVPSSPAAAGHLRGYFVNLATKQGSSLYYDNAFGSGDVTNLLQLLSYFSSPNSATSLPPALVERGSLIGTFDPAGVNFQSRLSALVSALQQLPLGHFYILPVLAGDSTFSGRMPVVGFARMQLVQVTSPSNGQLQLIFAIGESVPVRNAVASEGYAMIPQMQAGNFLPAAVSPFTARPFDPINNSVAARPRGVALAPSLSPRRLN